MEMNFINFIWGVGAIDQSVCYPVLKPLSQLPRTCHLRGGICPNMVAYCHDFSMKLGAGVHS